MKKVIFINSHPIQYFAPLYKYMTEQGIETTAWYCSDNSVIGGYDTEFGVNVKWDIPLLEGYNARFFKNNSWKASHDNGFFGLINLGLIKALFRAPKSTIVVHGWHYFTLFLVLLLGKSLGHTICLRNETPKNHEDLKKGWKQTLKRLAFTYLLFPRVHYFMYIGTQNRLFYKSYGLPDSQLVFCPYAVDNQRFQQASQLLSPLKATIKQRLGIPVDDKVILFRPNTSIKSGRLTCSKHLPRPTSPTTGWYLWAKGSCASPWRNSLPRIRSGTCCSPGL